MDVQAADVGSVLAHARAVVAMRHANPALMGGDISFLDTEGSVLAFTRDGGGEKILCVFNLGKTDEARFALPDGLSIAGDILSLAGAASSGGAVALPPRGAYLARVE